MKQFKPLLAPNEKVDLSTLSYPLLASTKLDGIRCIFYKGQILSRSLKQIQNKQLREKFEPIRKYSEDTQCILDGEIYSPKLNFQEITHFVMTQDLGEEKLPDHLRYYCFDVIANEDWTIPFHARYPTCFSLSSQFSDIIGVGQMPVDNAQEVAEHFERVLKDGFEGLILRNPQSHYKFGRGTVKEGIIFKVKPFLTFDAKITSVVQSTEVNEDAEKKVNELGRSVTSKKKNDRHLIEKASAFLVEYEGKPLKVTLKMTDEEKIVTWISRANLIGKTIEYKGMLVGAKDVPRHPVFIRFREDK
jgi:DNA ligase 1